MIYQVKYVMTVLGRVDLLFHFLPEGARLMFHSKYWMIDNVLKSVCFAFCLTSGFVLVFLFLFVCLFVFSRQGFSV